MMPENKQTELKRIRDQASEFPWIHLMGLFLCFKNLFFWNFLSFTRLPFHAEFISGKNECG